MEPRPPPPVTIEGGPGWQVEAPAGETIGEEPRPPRWELRMPRRLPVVAALAALAGFAAATLLADWRQDRLSESDAGVLSLEASPSQEFGWFDVTETDDGRVASTLVLDVRNTGPRPVGLLSVSVPGTGFETGDLRGLRVEAGRELRVTLLRPIDCADLPQVPAGVPRSKPVRVRAVTDAGRRETDLSSVIDAYLSGDDVDRSACGELTAEEAVQVEETSQRYREGINELTVELRNASRYPLSLVAVRPRSGLTVQVLEGDAPVTLPLLLPAADFRRPRPPYDPSLPGVRLTLRVSVADCSRLPGFVRPGEGVPLFQVDVEGESGSGTAFVGDGESYLARMLGETC